MIITQYLKRFFQVLFDRSDYIIIEKELFPYAPYWLEKICLGNKKYIIDIDDAVFLNYEQSSNKHIRKFLGTKFNQLFANSYAVLAGSPLLQQTAIKTGAKQVIYYPTVIEWDNYQLAKSKLASHDQVVIGWIGNNSTVKYLELIKAALEEVATTLHYKLKLCVIGATPNLSLTGIELEILPWSEAGEIDAIMNIDIGIMPLENTLWEQGKCAYKLIQYMACAKPVIASAVGANNLVVENAINGFVCQDNASWVTAFKTLIMDISLRKLMGQNGAARVHKHYTVDSNIKIFEQLLVK